MYQQGIIIEGDPDRKKEMEEIRDKKLALTEKKAENLCFWQDIQEGELPGQEETNAEAPKRKFPTGNSTVYHFHPIAFVEQMRLIVGGNDPNIIYMTRKWEKWTGKNKTSMTFSTFKFSEIEGFLCEPYGEETVKGGLDKRIPVGKYNLKWAFFEIKQTKK
ncbi:hypothetical protein [Xanthovirga aplysinae]|uniref:hypothetical protein n=1 Tax=Xanthovirga aplysinae TaxID=2529853 RepID=UPI0012BBFBD3|nr:hypothetical protein [Xanthovirga aplysinae]MTI31743.1 hypothetical protein [Xanthovirga aplysinae]